PESTKAQSIPRIAQREIALAITFPFESQYGIRAGMDRTINHAREMNPKKWKLWIGHWVDQSFHQMTPVGHQFVVLATKWHDSRLGLQPSQRGDAVAVQARKIDEKAGFKPAARGFDAVCAIELPQANYLRARHDRAALVADQVRQFCAHVFVAHDSCGRD